MSVVINARNLTKDFKDVKAVNDLSFTVEEGEVYGFLGQNGAGKSTTIRMLLTLISPTAGQVEIFGLNLYEHRKEILSQIGAIVEKPDLYKYLTAKENIRIFSKLSGVKVSEKKMTEQLAMVGLADRMNSKVKTYSQGMKQRLGLACALVHDPQLLILDEPTNGLDPQGIADMRNMIIHLSKDLGKTLVVSSHLLGEMEVVADSMLIINKGKKIIEGNVTELLNPQLPVVELSTPDKESALNFIKNSEWNSALKGYHNGAIRMEVEKKKIPELTKQLVENGIAVEGIRTVHSLEDYFLSQTRE